MMINTVMINMGTRMSSTALVSMRLREMTMIFPTSITSRVIKFRWSTIQPILVPTTLTRFRTDKSLVCFIIATFKCKIIPRIDQTKDKFHLKSLTLVLKRRFTIQSLKRSLSNFSTSCKLERIALMEPSLIRREEMVQQEGKRES